MTTNIGAEMIRNKGGFGFGKRSEEANYEKMKDMLHKEVERHFRPEFLNRLDDVIVFKSLTREDLYTIVEYELRKLRDRLNTQHLELVLDDDAKEFLIEKGYSPDFGARPLRRAIEHHIEDPVSEEILRGTYSGKAKILVSVKTETDADDEESKHLYFDCQDKPSTDGDQEKLAEIHEGT